jgi:hypothetical protein
MELQFPTKLNKKLNLNYATTCKGIKSLQKCQVNLTFELPMTSQRNEIKACLTFNSANNGNCLIMVIQDQINSTHISIHLTQVIPLSQPYTKLNLETISNRLNDCDIDLSLDESIEDGDIILNFLPEDNTIDSAYVFTMYKRVDKKVKPVSTTFPEECYVRRQVPVDPLLTLPSLPMHPPEFVPTKRITEERLKY